MWDFSSLLLNFQNDSCSGWSRLQVTISVPNSGLWHYGVTQLWLWEIGVRFGKPETRSAALLAKAIREWGVSIWVHCRKASLGGRWEAAKLPFRNKIEFNPRNSYCISVTFTAVKWVLQGRQKRRKTGCLLQGACNQRCSLLKKGRESRRKRSHICCPAKISLLPPCLPNYNLQT